MVELLKTCYQDAAELIRDRSGLFSKVIVAMVVIPVYFFFCLWICIDYALFEICLYLEPYKRYLGPYNRKD